jgi:hypothetical protein
MTKALWTIALLAFLVAASCSRTTGRETRRELGKQEQVTLPSRPNLAARTAPEKTADGAWTVEGFLRHAREMVGKEMTVHGVVQAVDVCPPDQERCEVVPRVVLVDDLANARKKLFVVADPPEVFFKDIALKSAQSFTGTAALWSPDGRLINLDGIMVVKLTKAAETPAAK